MAAPRGRHHRSHAARHIPAEIEARFPDIPWVEMRGLRNLLIHEYFGVNLSIIWNTIHRNLPSLPEKLEDILSKEEM